jgi:ParB-like nuclease domain
VTSPTITGIHPYAEKFPMLPNEELEELAESIRANGLRNPIVVTPDGLILDGRNRYAACERAGITPDTIVYEGDDLAEFVIDANVARRNMSTGARVMATALVLAADGRRSDGRWVYGALESHESVQSRSFAVRLREAGIVLDYTPNLAPQVVTGQLTLNAAFGQADAIRQSAEAEKIAEREEKKRREREAKEEAERNAKIVADLTEAGSKYVALIESGDLTPAAAWAAHREDTRKERERAAAERKALSELYTGMAKALSVVGGYGGYSDIRKLMKDYDPAELYPPMMARYFSATNLADALHLVTELIDWEKETRQ